MINHMNRKAEQPACRLIAHEADNMLDFQMQTRCGSPTITAIAIPLAFEYEPRHVISNNVAF